MTQPAASNHRYLDARVATASQSELQLMLLDGALRFARQARQLWEVDDQRSEAERLLLRTIDIAEELVRSVAGAKTEASQRLEEEYAFIFRQLVAARLNRDGIGLDAALELLSFQRETWRLACEKLKPPPMSAARLDDGNQPTAGFSFQA